MFTDCICDKNNTFKSKHAFIRHTVSKHGFQLPDDGRFLFSKSAKSPVESSKSTQKLPAKKKKLILLGNKVCNGKCKRCCKLYQNAAPLEKLSQSVSDVDINDKPTTSKSSNILRNKLDDHSDDDIIILDITSEHHVSSSIDASTSRLNEAANNNDDDDDVELLKITTFIKDDKI